MSCSYIYLLVLNVSVSKSLLTGCSTKVLFIEQRAVVIRVKTMNITYLEFPYKSIVGHLIKYRINKINRLFMLMLFKTKCDQSFEVNHDGR